MHTIQVFAYRGSGNIQGTFLVVDGKPFPIPILGLKPGMFNVRCIIEVVNDQLSYPDDLLGEKVSEFVIAQRRVEKDSKVSLVSENNFEVAVSLPFESEEYTVGCKVYEDFPVHPYGVLETVPVPTNMLTLYFFFHKTELKTAAVLKVEKHFDGYSHLGFFLADLPRMKALMQEAYGDKKLDLVNEFSTTELIDTLLAAGIIMIVWGINPYTYPIYSTDNVDLLLPLLGVAHPVEGVFSIDEGIKALSVIPGHKLKEWPDFLVEEWPVLPLHGVGEKTYLKPFVLKDAGSQTVITSFVMYRSTGQVTEARPIVNVDLLYDG